MTRLIRDRRVVALILGVGALFVVALLIELPSPERIQDWAEGVGPIFPLLFFIGYALVAVAPVPRTVLTVSCGVLFGAGLGSTVALTATAVAAALALLLVRALDRDRVASRLTHPAVRAIDVRLERRGWLAVGSLRLIAIAPFSVVNYCCGLSSVRFWPYLIATVVGSLPGTVATVILADALTGGSHPAMVVISGICLAIGVLGLVLDARWTPAPREKATEPVPVAD
ncbi:TVP38/TMEM64 family protein [Nocardia cyriacigeorgica]|uniref:TVP38/TMEM64 family protein n=1 Tax=Nocardia cyriacigeorgica TaxID=135487 RepID=UPI0002D6FEA9|nr:TVP38/TMEM64 family protein [Nocardia cyriacigeorgica]MBF6324117.1 TVP38/TMEM64 family protein [Nocardia cyriacigeorgica]MBF6415989.1 TVP38/TMEM64 family protein [Nocardia cyriacigeorgica]TLF60325.1 TVP38/TMEM64 family protein [Nocardia cyriacigeorgica]